MGAWGESGQGWHRVRRGATADVPYVGSRWTLPDLAITVGAFAIRFELGLAFLGLKLWQHATGYPGSALSFARSKWDGLVAFARSLLSGVATPSMSMSSMNMGPRSSGNHAFDAWRQAELARIDAEREKLRAAEREFAAYRDDLLHAKDREDFDRFMNSRQARA